MYIYNWITLLCTWNIVSQLYFNKIYILKENTGCMKGKKVIPRHKFSLITRWLLPFSLFLHYLKIFYWRIIALQCCIDFCHTTMWISHKYTYIRSILNLPPTSHPTLNWTDSTQTNVCVSTLLSLHLTFALVPFNATKHFIRILTYPHWLLPSKENFLKCMLSYSPHLLMNELRHMISLW